MAQMHREEKEKVMSGTRAHSHFPQYIIRMSFAWESVRLKDDRIINSYSSRLVSVYDNG